MLFCPSALREIARVMQGKRSKRYHEVRERNGVHLAASGRATRQAARRRGRRRLCIERPKAEVKYLLYVSAQQENGLRLVLERSVARNDAADQAKAASSKAKMAVVVAKISIVRRRVT